MGIEINACKTSCSKYVREFNYSLEELEKMEKESAFDHFNSNKTTFKSDDFMIEKIEKLEKMIKNTEENKIITAEEEMGVKIEEEKLKSDKEKTGIEKGENDVKVEEKIGENDMKTEEKIVENDVKVEEKTGENDVEKLEENDMKTEEKLVENDVKLEKNPSENDMKTDERDMRIKEDDIIIGEKTEENAIKLEEQKNELITQEDNKSLKEGKAERILRVNEEVKEKRGKKIIEKPYEITVIKGNEFISGNKNRTSIKNEDKKVTEIEKIALKAGVIEKNKTEDDNKNIIKVKGNNQETTGRKISCVENYPLDILTLINKVRANPKAYTKVIEAASKKIISLKNKLVFNGNIRVYLHKGRAFFKEAINYLNDLKPMEPLIMDEALKIDMPTEEELAKDNDGIFKKKVLTKLKSVKLDGYFKDALKDPETAVLMMLVDDTLKHAGKKREILMDKNLRYVYINYQMYRQKFIAYYSFSKVKVNVIDEINEENN